MTDREIRDQLRAYVLRKFLPGESASNLRDETALRTSGILDSMATIELVTHVEDTYGIELEAHETGVGEFDRIADIAALVVRKRTARGK